MQINTENYIKEYFDEEANGRLKLKKSSKTAIAKKYAENTKELEDCSRILGKLESRIHTLPRGSTMEHLIN